MSRSCLIWPIFPSGSWPVWNSIPPFSGTIPNFSIRPAKRYSPAVMLKISETLPESSPLGQQKMKIRLEQLNPVIGDLEGNRSLILKALKDAVADRVDLLVLPEMVLTGYPAEDLLEYGAFREAC